MEVPNEKNIFKTENTRENMSFKGEYLTYHNKLKKEIESIPKEHKLFFRNALNKHIFDMEVYIPNKSEKNRKSHPNKNYLINKLIQYEKFVNLNKDTLEKNSKELSKFTKDYNFIRENNAKQKDYINNLLKFYKDRDYKLYTIEYTKNDNIFSRSILLDNKLGEETIHDALRYGNNKQNKKNFSVDNQLIAKFNEVIHQSKSPNANHNNKNRFNNFNDNINGFFKENNINTNNINKEEKKIIIKKKKRKKKDNNKNKEQKKPIEDNPILANKKEPKTFINENEQNNNDIDKKNTILSNYIKNIRLNKINNNVINQDEDNLNTSNKSSKIDNTITTYYGNDSLIFNESKNNEENEKNQNRLNLKINTLGGKNKNDQKQITNIATYNNYKNNNNINKLYLSDYNNSNKRIKLIKKENKENNSFFNINNNNNTNNNKNKLFIFSKEKLFDYNNKNKYKSKDNLKLNLPEINPSSTSYKIFLSYDKNAKNKNISKSKSNSKEINNIKPNSNSKANIIQRNIKNLKETFSKKNSKVEFYKNKAKEINNLYSTINLNSQFFKEYPLDKVEKYFIKYKKLRISKLNPSKGSNVHPLLEGLENIVKEKELYKLARSLNETKKDIYLRSTGTLDNFEKIKILDSEKIKEYDNKIPLLKYDFAENILCENENFCNRNNN